jgi:lysophospholipase L1-like esterase
VQYFCKAQTFTTNVTAWEKMNLEEEVSRLGQEVGLISIPSNQIELTWEANYYYNSTGVKISYSAPELKVTQVDVSSLIGNTLSINCACNGLEYCLFVDNNSEVLDSWQQNGIVEKIVPTSAKYLLLTNIFRSDFVLNPSVRINDFVSYDSLLEQTPGNSTTKLMSQNAITRNLTFVYKDIDIQWEQFHYWKSDGQKEYVSPSDGGTVIYASQKIDVSNYVGLGLSFLVYNDGDAYSLFLDESNNVLEYWCSQTEQTKIIPNNAKWLCLSCFISQSYITNPFAKVRLAGDITDLLGVSVRGASDITPSDWAPGYYYTKYGVKTALSGADVLRTAECSMVGYSGREIEIDVYCEGEEYCLFVTSDNTVIEYFQPQAVTKKIVPENANKLLLTNIFRENGGNLEPYVLVADDIITSITDFISQNSGNDRVKTMSQKAIAEFVGSTRSYKVNLTGKVMAFLGDSITAISDSYPNYVAPYYNAIQRNLGIGGTAITRGIRSNPFIERVTQANIADADCLCVLGGINDFLLGATLGVPFVEETITGSTYVGAKRMVPSVDTGGNYTFCGCLHELINAIRDIKPTIPILFITPLQESYYDSQDYEYPASFEQNIAGCYQKDYVEAIKQICQYYSIPVLDAFSLSGIDFKNDGMVEAYCWADRLHPSAAGSAFLAALVVKYINQHLYII